MYTWQRNLLSVVVVTSLLFLQIQNTTAQNGNLFLYMEITNSDQASGGEEGEVVFHIIDPSSGNEIEAFRVADQKLNRPRYRYAQLNSQGTHAYLYGNFGYFSSSVLVIDLRTQQVEEIVTFGVGNLMWSPDGQYLAMLGLQEQFSQKNDIFIYSVHDSTLINITRSAARYSHSGLAWSPDSRQVVTQVDCGYLGTCPIGFEIWNVNGVQQSFFHAVGHNSFPMIGCNLGWSPNGRYINFVADYDYSCGTSLLEVPREVYIYDVENNTLRQVTHFLAQVYNFRGSSSAFYDTSWINEETLFISGDYCIIPCKSGHSEVVAVYHTSEDRLQILPLNTPRSWLRNDATGLTVAFVPEFSLNSLPTQRFDVSQTYTSLIYRSFDLFPVDNPESVPTKLDNICNPEWSFSGAYLSYTRRSQDDCAGNIEAIHFLATNILSDSYIIEPSLGSTIVPVGWISR